MPFGICYGIHAPSVPFRSRLRCRARAAGTGAGVVGDLALDAQRRSIVQESKRAKRTEREFHDWRAYARGHHRTKSRTARE